MVVTKDELLEKIKTKIGEDTSDESISLIEDINDTYDDLQNRVSEAGDWKTKYEENDASWRTKYKERFFSKEVDETAETPQGEMADDSTHEALKYEDLFSEVKESEVK